MRNKGTKIALVIALAAIAGCVSVQSTRLGAGLIRAPVTPDQVAIYRSAAQVGGQYEEVALMSAAGDYGSTNEEQMYKKMREKAAAMGANGIILESITEPTTGAKVAQALLWTSAERKGRAVAIYVDSGARQAVSVR